jgi:hypothetical protein
VLFRVIFVHLRGFNERQFTLKNEHQFVHTFEQIARGGTPSKCFTIRAIQGAEKLDGIEH